MSAACIRQQRFVAVHTPLRTAPEAIALTLRQDGAAAGSEGQSADPEVPRALDDLTAARGADEDDDAGDAAAQGRAADEAASSAEEDDELEAPSIPSGTDSDSDEEVTRLVPGCDSVAPVVHVQRRLLQGFAWITLGSSPSPYSLTLRVSSAHNSSVDSNNATSGALLSASSELHNNLQADEAGPASADVVAAQPDAPAGADEALAGQQPDAQPSAATVAGGTADVDADDDAAVCSALFRGLVFYLGCAEHPTAQSVPCAIFAMQARIHV